MFRVTRDREAAGHAVLAKERKERNSDPRRRETVVLASRTKRHAGGRNVARYGRVLN